MRSTTTKAANQAAREAQAEAELAEFDRSHPEALAFRDRLLERRVRAET